MASEKLFLESYELAPLESGQLPTLLRHLFSAVVTAGASTAEIRPGRGRTPTRLQMSDLLPEPVAAQVRGVEALVFLGADGWYASLSDDATGLDLLLPEHIGNELREWLIRAGARLSGREEAVQRPVDAEFKL